MSYPKTLGELWDMGPEAVDAWEQVERWEHAANEKTLADELAEEQAQWLLDLVKAVLDACQADY